MGSLSLRFSVSLSLFVSLPPLPLHLPCVSLQGKSHIFLKNPFSSVLSLRRRIFIEFKYPKVEEFTRGEDLLPRRGSLEAAVI